MHDQRLAGVEIGEQIFGATAQVRDRAGRSAAPTKRAGSGKAQVRPPRLDARRCARRRKWRSSPRRTVSTSGSSGMVLHDGEEGGAEFLQFLLADAVDLGHFGEVAGFSFAISIRVRSGKMT